MEGEREREREAIFLRKGKEFEDDFVTRVALEMTLARPLCFLTT